MKVWVLEIHSSSYDTPSFTDQVIGVYVSEEKAKQDQTALSALFLKTKTPGEFVWKGITFDSLEWESPWITIGAHDLNEET